ncbi:MAG TPA: hypothetical protein PLN21_07360 [Gemmatales bacterium]|nr:hypothetical protein [Gemmatales bacterium]
MRSLVYIIFLVITVPVWAQAPTEYNTDWLNDPYQLQLIIQAEPHPLLTNVYIEQFSRDLGDSLQRDLGRTAKVSTIIYRDTGVKNTDLGRQMMEAVIERGWGELDNLPKQINSTKVHLVRLFYADGEYEVQSRQVDGDTSFVSPLRKAKTTDRQWITRLAALQLAQDFGQVGEIMDVNGQTLRIKLRSAGLGVPETIRMVQGEVMAVTSIRRTASNYVASRLPETLAYITNVDAVKGEVTARLYTRLQNALTKDRQTVGFRTIKLGTRIVPLQLRILDQDNNPINGYSVSHFPSGYEYGGAEQLGTTDAQGRIVSKDPIYHVAFVRVQIAGVGKLDAPVALIEDQPVVIKISGNREAAILDETKFEYERWMKRYNLVKESFEVDWATLVSAYERKGDFQTALKNKPVIATKMLESVNELQKEIERVVKAAGTNKEAQKLSEHAQKTLKSLADSIKEIEEQVSLEVNPTEDRKYLKLAIDAEREFDYDEVIKNLKLSLTHKKDQPKVIEKLKALEGVWKTRYKDKDHVEARTFALKVWANKAKPLSWEEISREIHNAERYLDDLMVPGRGDYLTAMVMINADLRHLKTLNAALDSFGNKEEDQDKVQIIEKAKKELIDFNRKAYDFAEKARNDEIKDK